MMTNQDQTTPPSPRKSSPVTTVFLAVAAITWLSMAYGIILIYNVFPIIGIPLFFGFMWLSFGDES